MTFSIEIDFISAVNVSWLNPPVYPGVKLFSYFHLIRGIFHEHGSESRGYKCGYTYKHSRNLTLLSENIIVAMQIPWFPKTTRQKIAVCNLLDTHGVVSVSIPIQCWSKLHHQSLFWKHELYLSVPNSDPLFGPLGCYNRCSFLILQLIWTKLSIILRYISWS